MTPTIKKARRRANGPSHDTKDRTLVPAQRTRAPRQPQPTGRARCAGDAVPIDHPARKTTVAAARRQLIAATNAITDNRPSRDEIRKAHLMANRAIETLDRVIQQLADTDAEGHRKHAIKTAKTLKDARGRRRAPRRRCPATTRAARTPRKARSTSRPRRR